MCVLELQKLRNIIAVLLIDLLGKDGTSEGLHLLMNSKDCFCCTVETAMLSVLYLHALTQQHLGRVNINMWSFLHLELELRSQVVTPNACGEA